MDAYVATQQVLVRQIIAERQAEAARVRVASEARRVSAPRWTQPVIRALQPRVAAGAREGRP